MPNIFSSKDDPRVSVLEARMADVRNDFAEFKGEVRGDLKALTAEVTTLAEAVRANSTARKVVWAERARIGSIAAFVASIGMWFVDHFFTKQ